MWGVWADGPPVRFYANNAILIDFKGHRLLSMKSGGSNPHPFVECTGRLSEALGEHLRATFQHRPTRIDHAHDLRSPGLFDRMVDYTKQLAARFGLRWVPDGDWVTRDAGRTIYLGSRKSQVFVRIYEKGLQYAAKLGEPVTDELREWVRFELEFKPQNKAAKSLARSIDGPQLWGSTLWTNQLAREVLSMQTEPISIRERRESNSERALRFMFSQYSGHLRVLLGQCGNDLTEFGRAIAEGANLTHADGERAA
jgi:hypothetical protein